MEGTLPLDLRELVRLLRWLPELCFFEPVLPPELSFSAAKAAPPVNNDSARRLERIVFMLISAPRVQKIAGRCSRLHIIVETLQI